MLSEAVFAKYFFDIWGRFESAAISSGISPNDPSAKPIYFRFLTLMAFHVFMCEGVDTAVIECGIGGEHDSTNIIVSPVATAITSLGLDHIDVLGNSLSDIAWHKAGIFKSGAAAFTVPQSEEAMEVIHKRASEKGVSLAVVNRCPEIHSVKLGLAADFQKSNASLAIAAAAAGLRALGNKGVPNPAKINSSPLPEEFRRGLEQVQWPGRCEIRREAFSKIAWCIDGAHTIDSIEVAGRWFAEKMASSPSSKQTPRILLFNQQKRDADALATSLHKVLSTALDSGSPFTHVVFCTNVPFVDAGYRPDLVSINTNAAAVEKLSVQNTLAETWKRLDSKTEVVVKPTIEEAVHWCRDVARTTQQDLGEEAMVLVTGSLHLVGGVIEVLETGEKLKN